MRFVKSSLRSLLIAMFLYIPLSFLLAGFVWFVFGVVGQLAIWHFLGLWRAFYIALMLYEVVRYVIMDVTSIRRVKRCAKEWGVPYDKLEALVTIPGFRKKYPQWHHWTREEYLAAKAEVVETLVVNSVMANYFRTHR